MICPRCGHQRDGAAEHCKLLDEEDRPIPHYGGRNTVEALQEAVRVPSDESPRPARRDTGNHYGAT